MDGGGGERWSAVADAWAELWGSLAAPVWPPLLAAAQVGTGSRVLDVGCGTGELLGHLLRAGASVAGVDPAPAMARRAAERHPGATVGDGDVEHLPFADGAFDAVLAVNALQFADDTADALAELVRVLVPGGRVGIACWAEGARNDLDVVERAVSAAHEEEVPPDGPLRAPGGLEAALADAGLDVVGSGIVDVPWSAPDDDRLVRDRSAAPCRSPAGTPRSSL
ncbi:methyltransferase domain-containing protein [Isoptericola sp. NPDC057391]|uniref:class I SAM-dependent methyltransferase n=1 Tax=Isoptericola sp. NPDC057391 TaxID=3346117 RepID=UPI003644AF7A